MDGLNPTGLALLAEIADHKVYRDRNGHSWYRNWSNRATAEVSELDAAGWLRIEPGSKQWVLTDAGRDALANGAGA